MGKLIFSSVILLFVMANPLSAMGIKVSGTRGIPYRAECKNTSGKTIKVSGRSPQIHKFQSDKPILFCKIQKVKSKKGLLKLSVDQSRRVHGLLYIDRDASDVVLELPKGTIKGAVKFQITEVDRRGQRSIGPSKHSFNRKA
jgi:hypothetical protein